MANKEQDTGDIQEPLALIEARKKLFKYDYQEHGHCMFTDKVMRGFMRKKAKTDSFFQHEYFLKRYFKLDFNIGTLGIGHSAEDVAFLSITRT